MLRQRNLAGSTAPGVEVHPNLENESANIVNLASEVDKIAGGTFTATGAAYPYPVSL